MSLIWKTVKFGQIADFKNGLNYKANESGESTRVLGVGDFQSKSMLSDMSGLSFVSLEKQPSGDELLKDGDLVFVRSNGNKELVGRCLLVYPGNERVGYSGFTIRARLTTDIVTPNFLSLIIQNGLLKTALKREGAGTNISNLNQGILQGLEIPIPSEKEQTAIADLLSAWDEAIEKTERLIAAKEKQFNALLSRLITKQDHKHGPFKNNIVQKHLGDILTESRLTDTEQDPEKRLTVRLHLKGVVARDYRGTEADGATTFYRRKSGQLIYGKQNIFRGAIGIVPEYLDGYASSQDIPAFDISTSVNSDWLYFYFSRPGFYKRLELFASGSGSKRLHPDELYKIKVKLPSLDVQIRVANILNAAKKDLEIMSKVADCIRLQKRGLMQKLLSGQWRVRMEKEVA